MPDRLAGYETPDLQSIHIEAFIEIQDLLVVAIGNHQKTTSLVQTFNGSGEFFLVFLSKFVASVMVKT